VAQMVQHLLPSMRLWVQNPVTPKKKKNKRPKTKTTLLQPSDLWPRSQNHTLRAKIATSTNSPEKMGLWSLLQEKSGKTLEDNGLSNYFLNRTQIDQEIRTRIVGLHQIKKCLHIKRNNYQNRVTTQRVDKRDKRWPSRIYNELKKKTNQPKINNPINKWVNWTVLIVRNSSG
jgi:hypothetical protein